MDWPSTPAAPRFAFTRLYASHTSRFAIQNGFALSTEVLPFRVASITLLDNDAPSIQSYYRTFISTAGVSAPVLRIGTLALAKAICLSFFLCLGTTGSYVPHQSPDQDHAALMPDASWTVDRFPPTLSRGAYQTPVLTSVLVIFRHFISGSLAFVFLTLT
jgi:hypothetical protein